MKTIAGRLTEREIIERLRNRLPASPGRIVKAIGDDCAVLRGSGDHLLLVTTDTLVEDVHFDRRYHPAGLLGRKAAAVNLSDIAAMGGTPQDVLLSMAVPDGVENAWLDAFVDGFLGALAAHDVFLVGGDTVKSNHELVFSVTLTGMVNEGQVLYRAGAEVGDLVWLSGEPGVAAAGLALCRAGRSGEKKWARLVAAHLDPVPEVDLGQILGQSGLVHAMMDTSDGIATDLAHLCRESGRSAEIMAADLPASDLLKAAARQLETLYLDWALKGGEDFHLLFTSPPAIKTTLERLVYERTGRKIHCIGRITEGSGVFLLRDGERLDISYQGYDHFSKARVKR